MGGGGSIVVFDADGLSSNAQLGGFYLKVGHMFTDEFGLEARALTTGDDSASVKGTSVDAEIEVDEAYSVFARWNFLQDQDWALYGLLGGTHGDATAKAADIEATDGETGVSFGVGVDLYGNDSVAVTADAIRYLTKSDIDLYGANLGFHVRF
ncbi:MAG: outer membrane beta-barrel protein [Ectothiorhodospiraceae bacterium]